MSSSTGYSWKKTITSHHQQLGGSNTGTNMPTTQTTSSGGATTDTSEPISTPQKTAETISPPTAAGAPSTKTFTLPKKEEKSGDSPNQALATILAIFTIIISLVAGGRPDKDALSFGAIIGTIVLFVILFANLFQQFIIRISPERMSTTLLIFRVLVIPILVFGVVTLVGYYLNLSRQRYACKKRDTGNAIKWSSIIGGTLAGLTSGISYLIHIMKNRNLGEVWEQLFLHFRQTGFTSRFVQFFVGTSDSEYREKYQDQIAVQDFRDGHDDLPDDMLQAMMNNYPPVTYSVLREQGRNFGTAIFMWILGTIFGMLSYQVTASEVCQKSQQI